MNKIEKMIKEMCPNGVEFVKIEDVTIYEQPTNYIVKSTKYSDEYEIPVLTAGQTFILGYTNEKDGIYNASEKNPVIIFDDFTVANKWVDFNFKVKSSAMKIIKSKNEQKLLIRFLYHLMQYINYTTENHERHWISKYSQIEIPVPPIEIQREIVRILDNFTSLTAELTAELTARNKQYEYYRDKLLNDPVGASDNSRKGETAQVRMVKLEEIAEIGTGSSNTNEAVMNGKYPFYVRSQELLSKNEYEFDETAIITAGDGNVGKVYHYVEGKYALHQRAYRIHIVSKDVIPKYFYHYMKYAFGTYINKAMVQSSVSSIRRPMLNNFIVPIPKLEIQDRIVNILDNFDSICKDLNIGLPAEIEARKKQYEYYRDALLNFAETGNVDFVERERERERERIVLYKLIQYVWGYVEVRLGDICTIQTGKLNANEMNENGVYPFFTCDAKPYKIDKYAFDTSAIIISGNGSQVGHLNMYEGKFNAYQRTYVLDSFKLIEKRYLYYFMKSYLKDYIITNCKRGSVPYITLPMLQNFKIRVPLYYKQIKVIEILDTLDNLCNDLTQGLPAEIEARKKQYEYYRDKLLRCDIEMGD